MNKIFETYRNTLNEVISGKELKFKSPSTFIDNIYYFDDTKSNNAFSSLLGATYDSNKRVLNINLGGDDKSLESIKKFIAGDKKLWKPILTELKDYFVDFGDPKIKLISGIKPENITNMTNLNNTYKFKLVNGPKQTVIEEIYNIASKLNDLYTEDYPTAKQLKIILSKFS